MASNNYETVIIEKKLYLFVSSIEVMPFAISCKINPDRSTIFFSRAIYPCLNAVDKFHIEQQTKCIHSRNGLHTMFPQSRVIMVNNCDLNIGQNNCDYDFCHNWAALLNVIKSYHNIDIICINVLQNRSISLSSFRTIFSAADLCLLFT